MIAGSLDLRPAVASFFFLVELGRFEIDYPDTGEVDVPARLQIHHLLDREGSSG
jgi:hypothetical protein